MESNDHGIEFLFGMGSPRKGMESEKRLSRAWSQHKRVHGVSGLSPTLSSQETQGRYWIMEPKIYQKPRGYNEGGLHEISPSITSNSWDQNHLLVSATPKSTSTPPPSTATITQTTKTMEMQQQSMFPNYQPSTFSLEDFRARLSQLLEKDRDLKTREAHSFLMSHGFWNPKDLSGLYSKTLKVYLTTTPEKLLRQSTKFSPSLVIPLAGKWSIVATSESHKTESASSLSDILQNPEDVPEKYYLSEKRIKGLLKGQSKPQLLEHLPQGEIREGCIAP